MASLNCKLRLLAAAMALSPPPAPRRRFAGVVTSAAALSTSSSASYRAAIETELRARVEGSLPTTLPPMVADPMRHLALAGPPSLAAPAALCVAACELAGGGRERAIDAAAAINLALAGAWSHDRLPAIAGGELPFTAGIQLLTGDSIIPLAYEIIARSTAVPDPETALRVIVEVADAMGSEGMAGGQLARAEGGPTSASELVEVAEVRIYGCAAACGAMLAGAEEDEVARVRRFGEGVGKMLSAARRGDRAEAEELGGRAMAELAAFPAARREALWGLVESWREVEEGGGGPVTNSERGIASVGWYN